MVGISPCCRGLGGVLCGAEARKEKNMERKHISLWIDEEVLKICDANIKIDNAKNRSDYIERAIDFYNSYLLSQSKDEFINKTIMTVLQSTMNSFESRMARQLFKQSVEIAKVFWLIVKELNIDPENADTLHLSCVDEVKKINGAIQFPYKQID